jgi:hypothetical protein
MTITLTIDDAASSAIIQNVGLSQGWTGEDESLRVLTGKALADMLNGWALNGENIRVRNQQQADIKAKLASFVTVK